MPEVLHSFDIYVALSESESFGVAILEASACGLPVVVSDAGGLSEVVENGQTGIVVPRHDPEAASRAILSLISSSEIRCQFGQHGVERVKQLYSWEKSYEQLYYVFTIIADQ